MIKSVGSICSGIEAASVAWEPLGFSFKWFSEVAEFPSKVLRERFPNTVNLGDMNYIPEALIKEKIDAPDLICGGTPCQAFSHAGQKKGLEDERGSLTLKFVDIIEANDFVREKKGKEKSIVFWENVEGVLSDKTNAFGCLISELAGLENVLQLKKWPSAGIVRGRKRNIAWRVLDAKYFGLPQQRRRLYVLAGGKNFFPENVLFEKKEMEFLDYPRMSLKFEKEGHEFQLFREYSDCLYSAYGTKWNGNAAAYNGSLFVVQDQRIRRLTPLECERLMGFPDNYTNINGAKRTNRYQAIGNSWAVTVIQWIGKRLIDYDGRIDINDGINNFINRVTFISDEEFFVDIEENLKVSDSCILNCSFHPEICQYKSLKDIIEVNREEKLYISPVGCAGILRRKSERKMSINSSLEKALMAISKKMSAEEIEMVSRRQSRGKYSQNDNQQIALS